MSPTVHHHHHHHNNHHYHGGSGGVNTRMLIQILLILLLNFLPSSSEPVCSRSGPYPYKHKHYSEPVYSLSRAYPYEQKYATEKGVSFYVKSEKFAEEYPAGSVKRVALESRVEREYFGILSQHCRLEIYRRRMGFAGETLHCDILDQFNVKDYDYY